MRLTGLLMCFFLVGVGFAADNPRIFVTDSSSWEMSGGAGGSSDGFGGISKGGARPQTAEIVKTFNERCPNAVINNKRDKADYIVVLDHEGGKDAVRKDNKIAIFERESGDAVYSGSTRSLGNAVKDGCSAIYRDWSRRAATNARKASIDADVAETKETTAPLTPAANGARVEFTSAPGGAEIIVNGNFVGSTPSKVSLAPGKYTVEIRKNGFQSWKRDVVITGGDITLTAELMK